MKEYLHDYNTNALLIHLTPTPCIYDKKITNHENAVNIFVDYGNTQ